MSVDILLSYAFHAKTRFDEVREALGPNQHVMIDSGAFTAFTKGRPVDREQYAKFLKHWEGCYDYAMTLDVIGDGEATEANLQWLLDQGLPVIPVYTARAPMSELESLADRFDYIAYGGLVGVPKNLQMRALKVVTDRAAQANCRVHALGQASARTFTQTVTYSGDSSKASNAPMTNAVSLTDFSTGKIVTIKFGDRSSAIGHERLMRAYGLNPAECFGPNKWKGANRDRIFRAGVLAVAVMSAHLKTDSERPVVYSAFTPGDMNAILRGARDWRTGNLPREFDHVLSMGLSKEKV